jgi:hypothetical protein
MKSHSRGKKEIDKEERDRTRKRSWTEVDVPLESGAAPSNACRLYGLLFARGESCLKESLNLNTLYCILTYAV